MPHFLLQRLEASDYQVVSRWLATPTDMTKVCANTFKYPLQEDAFVDYFIDQAGREKNRFCYKFVDRVTNIAVGMISFTRIDWKNNYGHLGLVAVDPNARGQGIGKQMVEAVLTEGFNRHQFHRIELIVIETNEGAHRFYVDKLGFRDEGLIRDIVKLDQNYLSWYSLSLLADEWRARGGKRGGQIDATDE